MESIGAEKYERYAICELLNRYRHPMGVGRIYIFYRKKAL